MIKENGLYVLPTVPATIETLKSDIQTLLDRLSAIPIEDISREFTKSIKLINEEMIPSFSKWQKKTD